MDIGLFDFLTTEQQKRYKELEALFTHPGWSLFVDYAKGESEIQLERLVAAKGWDENRLATGARAAYLHVANLREITELQFEQLAEANKGDLEEVELVE